MAASERWWCEDYGCRGGRSIPQHWLACVVLTVCVLACVGHACNTPRERENTSGILRWVREYVERRSYVSESEMMHDSLMDVYVTLLSLIRAAASVSTTVRELRCGRAPHAVRCGYNS